MNFKHFFRTQLLLQNTDNDVIFLSHFDLLHHNASAHCLSRNACWKDIPSRVWIPFLQCWLPINIKHFSLMSCETLWLLAHHRYYRPHWLNKLNIWPILVTSIVNDFPMAFQYLRTQHLSLNTFCHHVPESRPLADNSLSASGALQKLSVSPDALFRKQTHVSSIGTYHTFSLCTSSRKRYISNETSLALSLAPSVSTTIISASFLSWQSHEEGTHSCSNDLKFSLEKYRISENKYPARC